MSNHSIYRRALYFVFSYIIIILLLLNFLTFADQEGRESGTILFRANHDILYLGTNISAIYFDTSECVDCKNIYPAYRFIDDLKIDRFLANIEE